jgi:hypothetical protein
MKKYLFALPLALCLAGCAGNAEQAFADHAPGASGPVASTYDVQKPAIPTPKPTTALPISASN